MPRGKQAPEPAPPIDPRVRKGVMIGGRFILACAAGISFPSLYQLARIAGLAWYLAPLFPIVVDAYAYTAMWFADQVPARHPARASALRNGAVALMMSVACNVLDRFLTLAGSMVQLWVRDVLLSLMFALPPFIVGRVLHLRALADGNTDEATQATATPPRQATPPRVASPVLPAVAQPQATLPQATPAAVKATPVAPIVTASGNTSRRRIPISKDDKDKIVARLLALHGDDLNLTVIAEAIGTKHRATAMKVRDRVIEARDTPQNPESDPAEDPEPALAVN